MNSYHVFAEYYDVLTKNVPYAKRGIYFHQIIQKYGVDGNILLDLACGTGTLSFEMYKYGYNILGVDGSTDMLSIAIDKKYERNLEAEILFLCQPMEKLNLFGGIDICICALDSLNHILTPKRLLAVLKKVSLFMNPNGLFIFDVNTMYKHEKLLSGQTFIYDCDEVYCVWQNSVCKKGRINITLDMFCREKDGSFVRETEQFSEQAYSHEEISSLLETAGMKIEAFFPDPFEGVTSIEYAPRILYVVRNIKTKQHEDESQI